MPLTPGSRIGIYEIVAAIGAGGMGEVYKARDTKLHRDVAIKVLPDMFAGDLERLARFEREARTLAALNHPHIAQVFGVEESRSTSSGQAGTIHALVMEFVDGEDLSQRIARAGAIPLDEVLPIARQITEALEAAHEQGIIHRDLKPANIKVRPDGTVKVLDFGLAKALGPPDPGSPEGLRHGLENSPTITSPFQMSQLGVILGTAAYMAPEQAKGKPVDKRSDIWGFGCVLYEMLTGERAFKGEDLSDTLAAVLRQELDLRALPASAPPALGRLIARCLERHPKQRLRDIGEARIELARLESGAVDSTDAMPGPAIAAPPRWRRTLPWALAGVMTAAFAAALVVWSPWRPAPSPAPVRLSVETGADSSLDIDVGTAAIASPDGRTFVFVGSGADRRLFARSLDRLQATPIAGTEGAYAPFFSPDGQWVGFFAGGKLKKVSVTGGAAVTLCSAANGRGGSWGDDDTIIFQGTTAPGPLMQVPASGGIPAPITAGRAGVVRWPQILPGGKAVLYTANDSTLGFEGANLVVQPLPAGAPKILVRGGFHGRYVRSGHIVYMHEGTLFAAPFDLERLEVTGRAAPALEGVMSSGSNGGAQFAVSDSGTLVYSPGQGSGGSRPIFWMDRTGATTPLRATPAEWGYPRFSPDGRLLALAINDGTQFDIWVYDWTRDIPTKLTIDPGYDGVPVWAPDGRWIAFGSDRALRGVSNLYGQRADGGGDVQRLTNGPNSQSGSSFHPDGKLLAFTELTPQNGGDLMILPIDGDETKGWRPGTPRPFLSTPANETSPMFSPDGRWIAYMSDEAGATQVFVRPFPGPGGRWQISTGNLGVYPAWSRTSPELFFLDPTSVKIMIAGYAVEGSSFRAGKPRVWSPASFMPQGLTRAYDLHPDGLRVAIGKPPESALEKRDKVVMIFNFFEELRRVAPVGRRP